MKQAIFTVTRNTRVNASSFSYKTVDGTAVAGRDYVAKQGTVTFPSDADSATVVVDVYERPANSLDLYFTLEITSISQNNMMINEEIRCVITTDQSNTTPLTWPVVKSRMFDPKFWTIDSQATESCSIISNGDSFTARMVNRTVAGLAGIIWSTYDKYDHKGLGYQEHSDLSKEKLWFKMELSQGVPGLKEEKLLPSLTVTLKDETVHYVSLNFYAEEVSEDGKTATIKLDFSNLKSGPENDIVVDTTQIDNMFFSLISTRYQEIEDIIPVDNEDLSFKFTILEPDTGYSMMNMGNLNVPAHTIRMCTSYDDMYNLTPERVISNTYRLGYRDMINHYNGMSHYYQFSWDAGSNKWALNRTEYLNPATEAWFDNFHANAKAMGYTVMNSLSFELMSTVCPVEWVQHTWNDDLAATGYEPPSYVLSPSIDEGMNYLQGVINKIASISAANDLPVIIQVGEPWWWYNTATNLPCIYDYTTKVAFNNETGLYAQDVGTVKNYKTGTPYDEYYAFLSKTLGLRVAKFATDTRLAYPGAKVTLLPFVPSILGNGMMEFVNFPKDYYIPENFDFYCSECYDWLLEGKMERSFDAITIPNEQLGFSYDKIHYLAGFVPDATLAPLYGFDPESNYRTYLWKMIIGNIVLNDQKFVGLYQYIWAYPQIMHDSITVLNSKSQVFYMGNVPLNCYLQDITLKQVNAEIATISGITLATKSGEDLVTIQKFYI